MQERKAARKRGDYVEPVPAAKKSRAELPSAVQTTGSPQSTMMSTPSKSALSGHRQRNVRASITSPQSPVSPGTLTRRKKPAFHIQLNSMQEQPTSPQVKPLKLKRKIGKKGE